MAFAWKDVRAVAGDHVACISMFTRYARALVRDRGDGEALNELRASLRDAVDLAPLLRRHMLVTAAREALCGDDGQHNWVRELGCDEYMTLEWNIDLIDGLREPYYFAEFLCFVNAGLRGHQPIIMDELLPGGELFETTDPATHGMRLHHVIAVLGNENWDALPHVSGLRPWLKIVQACDG